MIKEWVVEEHIPSLNVDFARISLSAGGVIRNRSTSNITDRQPGSTPHLTNFSRQGQRKL
tara:strand:- start:3206 stop:3385 length:180 start_codon:yes stop_codon:yes gene_type:complete